MAERVKERADDPLAVFDEVREEHSGLRVRTREHVATGARRISSNLRAYLGDHPEVVTRTQEVEAHLEFLLEVVAAQII